MPANKSNCPVCPKNGKFLTPASVELDSCDAHGIWLDSHELEIILKQGAAPASQEPSAFEGAGRNFVRSAVGAPGSAWRTC